MRILLAVMLATMALAPSNAGAESAPVDRTSFSVPFELIRGHIYVQAFVNGKGPYRFVFDNGASGVGRADTRLVAEQGLTKVGQTENSDGINVSAIDVVKVQSLRLGGLERRDVELLSRDYNRNRKADRPVVMGIIGADFFAEHTITIDYPAGRIHFSSSAGLRPGGAGVIAYGEKFAIPVCFSKRCYVGKIDTGSSQTLVLPKSIVGEIAATAPVHVGTGSRANTVSQMYEMELREPVRISGVSAAGLKVRYADPSDDEINIGSNLLKDYVLTIDSRRKLLKIERPSGSPGERG